MMNVRELIELLEDMASEVGDDAVVLAAYQPSYPLAGSVQEPTLVPDDDDDDDDTVPTVWLPIGNVPSDLSPYAPSGVWSEW